jgi:hypothetical protein
MMTATSTKQSTPSSYANRSCAKNVKLDAKPFHLLLSKGKNSERVRDLPLKRSLNDCVRTRERVGR